MSHPKPISELRATLIRWIDSEAPAVLEADGRQVDWLRTLPFIALHAAAAGVIWVGVSPMAVTVAIVLYLVRMFAITGFYHRYFSHKSFRTSRLVQFLFATIAASSVQRGPLWWASQHRHHHAHADEPEDVHSPLRHGFLWSHMGWFLCRRNFRTRLEMVKEWAQFPELRFLDRWDALVPTVLAVSLFAIGELLEGFHPQFHTNGPQLLVWGFVISTLALYHVTFCVNSLAHVWGSRRYPTRDGSRNNALLALLTLGEGWHNNHHHYPVAARQGFYWWEFDPTYYALQVMAWLGIVWDLHPVPPSQRESHRNRGGNEARANSGVRP